MHGGGVFELDLRRWKRFGTSRKAAATTLPSSEADPARSKLRDRWPGAVCGTCSSRLPTPGMPPEPPSSAVDEPAPATDRDRCWPLARCASSCISSNEAEPNASSARFGITRYRLAFCVLVRVVRSACSSGNVLRYFEKAEDCHYHYPLSSAARKTTSKINISVSRPESSGIAQSRSESSETG
uniref:Uncharacterized protein n=1 Tax=Anopheles melas TaxID=34690 RepID=A0A182TMP4_9DIPT